MRWPIRVQLLAPLLVLLLGIAVTSVCTAITSARQARRQIEARLRSMARFLSESWRIPLTPEVLRQMKPLAGAEFLVWHTEGPPASSLPDAEVPALPANLTVHEDWRDLGLGPVVVAAGVRYRCGAIRLRQWPNEGDVLVILYPESLWRDALWEATWPSLVLGGSLGAVSLALALGLSAGLARRVRDVEQRTRLIAAGDFSPMPVPARDDELRDLARSINEMAAQLDQYRETAQRSERLRLLGQVSGGLAHQLRNGLTGARLALQLHLRGVGPTQDTAALDVALRQMTLLEAYLKRFLDLGHDGPVRREACDLGALISEALDLLRPRCRHAGIELPDPAGGSVAVEGDPGQLGQLLLNLLGNAVEAAGPGGAVEVKVAREDGRVGVEVWDTGPGPPADLAGRLFEPFVTGKPEGVGLGLAVARQVAEAHGGTVSWRREDGRTCFRVDLPALVQPLGTSAFSK